MKGAIADIVTCSFVIKAFITINTHIYEKIIWLDFAQGFDGSYAN